jgi:hypothetical protein
MFVKLNIHQYNHLPRHMYMLSMNLNIYVTTIIINARTNVMHYDILMCHLEPCCIHNQFSVWDFIAPHMWG